MPKRLPRWFVNSTNSINRNHFRVAHHILLERSLLCISEPALRTETTMRGNKTVCAGQIAFGRKNRAEPASPSASVLKACVSSKSRPRRCSDGHLETTSLSSDSGHWQKAVESKGWETTFGVQDNSFTGRIRRLYRPISHGVCAIVNNKSLLFNSACPQHTDDRGRLTRLPGWQKSGPIYPNGAQSVIY